MAKYFKCPDVPTNDWPCLFLAGGISNCPNWQEEVAEKLLNILKGYPLNIVNPRRDGLPNPAAQIHWEYDQIKAADCILFWFPAETLCPITLFEYGKELGRSKKKIFAGFHPDYTRKLDLIIQTERYNQDVYIENEINLVMSIDALCKQVEEYILVRSL